MIIESIYYRFFSFYYEYIMKILNYDRIKKKVADVFGWAQGDLHVFKMKRLIGKVKNESFICISLVASFPRRALARLPRSCSSDDDPSRHPRLTKEPSSLPFPVVGSHLSAPSHFFLNRDFCVVAAPGQQAGGWEKRNCLFLFSLFVRFWLARVTLRPLLHQILCFLMPGMLTSVFSTLAFPAYNEQHSFPEQDFCRFILL